MLVILSLIFGVPAIVGIVAVAIWYRGELVGYSALYNKPPYTVIFNGNTSKQFSGFSVHCFTGVGSPMYSPVEIGSDCSLVLYLGEHSYPVGDLSVASLVSLGATEDTSRAYVLEMISGTGSHYLRADFDGQSNGAPTFLTVYSPLGQLTPSPYRLSFNGSDPVSFPLSLAELEDYFGPPDTLSANRHTDMP